MAHSKGRSLVLMCYVAMCYVLCCSHMPRLPTLRTRVLQELARQLRFESADAARRQLARAEDLALQLLDESGKPDAPAAYPEEWVVFRITGLRMEARGGDGGVVVREALLGDLPALIDRLSAAGKITESDLRGTGKRTSKDGATGGRAASATPSKQADAVWLSVAELCARWKVSRKTLERYRRVGLVSRRITLGRGREKVVYSEACVRMFERVHRERVEEAGDIHDLPDVIGGVVQAAQQGLLHAVRLAADGDCLAQVGLRQCRQRREQCFPTQVPRGQQAVASVLGGQDKFHVAVARRLLAITGKEIGPTRGQVSGQVFDNQGDRIDRVARPTAESVVGQVRHGPVGKVLGPVELVDDVGDERGHRSSRRSAEPRRTGLAIAGAMLWGQWPAPRGGQPVPLGSRHLR